MLTFDILSGGNLFGASQNNFHYYVCQLWLSVCLKKERVKNCYTYNKHFGIVYMLKRKHFVIIYEMQRGEREKENISSTNEAALNGTSEVVSGLLIRNVYNNNFPKYYL